MFSAMQYGRGRLKLIDQRLLPSEEVWLEASDLETVAVAVETMAVRGAPAIGCAAGFALALDAAQAEQAGLRTWGAYRERFRTGVARLARTRPTAVNLFYALDKMQGLAARLEDEVPIVDAANAVERLAQELYDDDLATCRAIGRHGADHIAAASGGRRQRVLTHCNAGSLATAGYGTAVGSPGTELEFAL